MTRLAGKTTAVEGLVQRWENQKIIIFVTKRGEESFTHYPKIQPFLKQRTDWQYLMSLIEATMGNKEKMLRTVVMKVSETASTLVAVQNNITYRMSRKKVGGFEADMLYQLQKILELIVPKLEEYHFVTVLHLVNQISVMDLTGMPTEIQAMVIGAVAQDVHENRMHVTLVIPEAWEMLPLARGSPAKLQVETLVRKGAVNHNFVVLDSQDIAGVHPPIRKQIGNWLLGKQMEENEVDRTLNSIPLPPGQKIRTDQIQNLKLGQFYKVSDGEVKLIFARPAWMDEETAIACAKDPKLVETFKPPIRITPVAPQKSKGDGGISITAGTGGTAAPPGSSGGGATQGVDKFKVKIQRNWLDEKTVDPVAIEKLTDGISAVGHSPFAYDVEIGESTPTTDLYNAIQRIVRDVVRMELKAGLNIQTADLETVKYDITVSESHEALPLDDKEIIGQICLLQADGFFKQGRAQKEIAAKLKEEFGASLSGPWYEKFRTALTDLCQRRYNVLKKDSAVYLEGGNKVKK